MNSILLIGILFLSSGFVNSNPQLNDNEFLNSIALEIKTQNKILLNGFENLMKFFKNIDIENSLENFLTKKVVEKLQISLSDNQKIENFQKQLNQIENQLKDDEDIYFNAISRKRVSCYDCNLTFDGIHADSHKAMDLKSGTYKCPKSGHYMLQFHALAESGTEVKIDILINGIDVMHLFDRDIGSSNRRFAMISQAFIHKLEKGDIINVRLHKGALKGGGQATFTSFLGFRLRNPIKPLLEL